MLFNSIFNKNISTSALDLPPLTLISLEKWILVKVYGTDAMSCLHNQLTCNIKNLNTNQYSVSAHCNAKGKMITNMYVFHINKNEFAYLIPKNICKKQMLAIKKYTIFSDVTITADNNCIIIGITGSNSKKYLNIFFNTLPNRLNTIIRQKDVIIMYFETPIERFLLMIMNKSLFVALLNQSKLLSAQYANHYQWIALDIESGYPYIDLTTSEIFFPQSANLDILNGISFNKGCFLGQEMIARIQYHHLNKHSLFHLTYVCNPDQFQLPGSGDTIELEIKNQFWKQVGVVLQSCQMQNNTIWTQAILNKNIPKINHLRLQNTKTLIKIFNTNN